MASSRQLLDQRTHSSSRAVRIAERSRALSLTFSLHEAQEIIALEAGYPNWTALKAAVENEPVPAASTPASASRLARAVPVIHVADVRASAAFFEQTLGFTIDFLDGEPPFYGSVSRDGASLHLKFVHEPAIAPGAHDRDGLITAFVEVENVKALYAEYTAASVTFAQKLQKEAWGGRDFIVRDLDGNGIAFVEPSA